MTKLLFFSSSSIAHIANYSILTINIADCEDKN